MTSKWSRTQNRNRKTKQYNLADRALVKAITFSQSKWATSIFKQLESEEQSNSLFDSKLSFVAVSLANVEKALGPEPLNMLDQIGSLPPCQLIWSIDPPTSSHADIPAMDGKMEINIICWQTCHSVNSNKHTFMSKYRPIDHTVYMECSRMNWWLADSSFSVSGGAHGAGCISPLKQQHICNLWSPVVERKKTPITHCRF